MDRQLGDMGEQRLIEAELRRTLFAEETSQTLKMIADPDPAIDKALTGLDIDPTLPSGVPTNAKTMAGIRGRLKLQPQETESPQGLETRVRKALFGSETGRLLTQLADPNPSIDTGLNALKKGNIPAGVAENIDGMAALRAKLKA